MPESIKDQVKKQYAKIALSGNSDCCCMPGECGPTASPSQAAEVLGYDPKDLSKIPESSILGVGCGAPLNFADLKDSETVVDLGSGAGIDVFLASNSVGNRGRVIGIDMTDEMLEKSRSNAKEYGYSNVEFRKGDIEKSIPVEENSVDAVISNCVINLTTDKTDAFKQIHRILKKGGRMVISDLVTDKEVSQDGVDYEKWCACIDGALTKEHYIESMKEAGFEKIEVLQERPYMSEDSGNEQESARQITSLIIRAVKQ